MLMRIVVVSALSLMLALGGSARAAEPAAAAAVQPKASDPLHGVFRVEHDGEAMTVTIRPAEGGGYEGTIEGGDEKYRFTAAKTDAGAGMKGKAQQIDGRETFDFTATITGEELTIDAEGEKIAFARVPGASAPVPLKADELAGEWTAKVKGRAVSLKLSKEGDGYVGPLTMGGREFTFKLKVDGITLAASAVGPGGEREGLRGEIVGRTLLFIDGGQRIEFTRAGDAIVTAAGARLEGRWTAMVEGKSVVMDLAKQGETYSGKITVNDREYTITLTRSGDEVTGMAISKEDGQEGLNGRIAGDKLTLVSGGQAVEFTREGAAGGQIALPSGITMNLPQGWTASQGPSFTVVKVPEAEGDVTVILKDEKLSRPRTHADFAKAFVELAEVYFLKPIEKELDTTENHTKVALQGERQDGTKIVGFAGIETRGFISLGAMIGGKNEDVEKVLDKADQMMKSAKWPGEDAVKIEIVPQPPGAEPKAPDAPAPAGAAPRDVEPGWKRVTLSAGLDLAAPPEWEIADEGSGAVSLVPPGEDETLVVLAGADAANGISDLLGAETRRRLTSAAEEVEVDPKLVGEPRTTTVNGHAAAVYTFESKPEQPDEPTARIVLHIMLAGDKVYTLAAHGTQGDVAKHARTVERIFQSFKPKAGTAPAAPTRKVEGGGMGGRMKGAMQAAGAIDPKLVGVWRATRAPVADKPDERIQTTITLSADGTFKAENVSITSTEPRQTKPLGGPMMGRWSLAAGKMALKYDNGMGDSVPYRVVDGVLEIGEGAKLQRFEAVR